jgi:hypothetical protein
VLLEILLRIIIDALLGIILLYILDAKPMSHKDQIT